ncbi:MAG TPA: hypothetical protein GX693_03975 [Firmicutes bacterium]|nr:hypothetical protein [Bacillota bacterium]
MKKVAVWLLAFLLAGGAGAVWASETGGGNNLLSRMGLTTPEMESGAELPGDSPDGEEPDRLTLDPLEPLEDGQEEDDGFVPEDPEVAEPDDPQDGDEGDDGTGEGNGEESEQAKKERGWRLREKVADESLPEHVRNNAQNALNNMQRAEEHHAWAQSNQGGPPPWSAAYEKQQSKPGKNKNGQDNKKGEQFPGGDNDLGNEDNGADQEVLEE